VDARAANLDVLESILAIADYGLVRANTADEALIVDRGGVAAIVLTSRCRHERH